MCSRKGNYPSETPEIPTPLWECFWARALLLSSSTCYSSPPVKVQHFQSSEFELHSLFAKLPAPISSLISPVYSLRGFLLVQTPPHTLSTPLYLFSPCGKGSLCPTAQQLFPLPISFHTSHTCHVFFVQPRKYFFKSSNRFPWCSKLSDLNTLVFKGKESPRSPTSLSS